MLASKSQFIQPLPASVLHSNPPSTTSMLSQPSPTNSDFSEGPGALEDIRLWDERKVVEWLRSIGCQKYDGVFEKNNITGETLLECDHSVLKELGITKVGDRVRIFVAVKALRTKAYGSGKKRNRDTLAALDNVGPLPSYRTPVSHLTLPQSKRYSGQFYGDRSTSLLSGNAFRPGSPTENDYRSSQQRAPRIISPPLENARSNLYSPPTGGSGASRTPRTPREWKLSGPPSGSPNNTRSQRMNPGTSYEDIMKLENVRNNCIKVIGEGGATRVIDVSGCTTPETIMKRLLKKFNISERWTVWGIWSIGKDRGGDNVRCLGDGELIRILSDSSRPERTRLILRRKDSPPMPSSREYIAAQDIARDQQETLRGAAADAIEENAKNPKIKALTGHIPHEIRPTSPMSMAGSLSPSVLGSPMSPRSRDSASSGINRKASKKITAFFGQRPPSELISSNLAEYFPDHDNKALEKTVRASMRRSARMSKYNSRLSVATTRSYASSIGSDVPPVPTVGDTWLNSSPQSTILPAVPMSKQPRPPSISIRRSILPQTSFIERDYLGAVPENDVSPMRAERKSYMSYDSRDSAQDSINVVVTDTGSVSGGVYLDSSSIISPTVTAVDLDAQPTIINQLLSGEDSEEEEENADMDESMDDFRWMKGTMIGSGSFGSVYLALNALTGELMAVKQVEMPANAKEDSRKQSMIDALTREIALLKELQHDNIVQYLASNKEDNCFNIFLEYVPGGSVAAMLTNYGPLKEPLIRNFVRQILQGLAYLHGKNIIHRDIKGANVLVDNKGSIKISDFGISKKVEAGLLTSSSANHRPSLQGSVFWMAPEVVKQTSYTLKADIWSLGCLIVEMFTGEHPYPDCSQLQAIFKIGTGGSAPVIPEDSTAEAKQFLGQTFELDHNKRPTADELLLSPFLLPLIGNAARGD